MKEIQDEIVEWSQRNFGRVENVEIPLRVSGFLGMVEELGELSHAILKWTQGIRGTSQEHQKAIEDAIADLLIFTLDFCGRNGMNAEELLTTVWAKVKQRDWIKNAMTGGENA